MKVREKLRALVLDGLHAATAVVADATGSVALARLVQLNCLVDIRVVAHARRVLGAHVNQIHLNRLNNQLNTYIILTLTKAKRSEFNQDTYCGRTDPEVLLDRKADQLLLQVDGGRHASLQRVRDADGRKTVRE